jgi:hypothetical protein
VVGPECPHGLENIIERLIFVIGSKETKWNCGFGKIMINE